MPFQPFIRQLNPEVAKKQFGADDIESFQDFTKACCEQIACGPFMKPACKAADQRVVERKLLEETLAKQISLEKERRERVARVYDRLRDLKIDVDEKESELPDLGPEPF